MVEELDERAAAGHVAAKDADRFRQRADLNIDAPVHAEVIDRPAAVLSEHAARVRIVNHHDAAEFFGQLAEGGQRAQIAVHAEDAVGDEQLTLRGRQPFEDLARGVYVLVREDLDRRPAQSATVDDAGVIQLVGNDDVVFGQQRRHRAGVRGETALEDDHGFGILEGGEPALELDVDGHRARDRPDRSGADTERARRFQRTFAQSGMRRQAQIVVRGQVDDLALVERGRRLLLALENAQSPVQALLFERVELGGEIGERVATHDE